ncbi:MAG: hypothetical protein ACYC8T_13775 [Myxococcaceae bacterium]
MSAPSAVARFSARAPVLELTDELAELLGALPPGGTFRYTYEDAVKLAGHSCPTVAGAYLMTAAGLKALYGEATPARGDIEVTLGGERDDGGSGPMSQVVSLLTGAAPETGFGGLMGHGRRKDLLRFDPSLDGRIRYRRKDTGAAVEVSYDSHAVPRAPEMHELLSLTLSGRATPAQRQRFGELWQAVVEDLLTGDLARVIEVRTVHPERSLQA